MPSHAITALSWSQIRFKLQKYVNFTNFSTFICFQIPPKVLFKTFYLFFYYLCTVLAKKAILHVGCMDRRYTLI